MGLLLLFFFHQIRWKMYYARSGLRLLLRNRSKHRTKVDIHECSCMFEILDVGPVVKRRSDGDCLDTRRCLPIGTREIQINTKKGSSPELTFYVPCEGATSIGERMKFTTHFAAFVQLRSFG